MLRVAEVAEMQESMMIRSALDKSQFKSQTGLNIGRQQMSMSVDILLSNTKLSSLPGCAAPAMTLGSIATFVESGNKPLTPADLIKIADSYACVQRARFRPATPPAAALQPADVRAIESRLPQRRAHAAQRRL